MHPIRSLVLIFVCSLCAYVASPARAAEDLKLYVFGNSLIYHQSETNQTAVPYWVTQFAKAAGNQFRMDGEWGFLRDFSSEESPKAQWLVKGVDKAWTRDIRNYADVAYDVVMTNPANFIQYKQSDEPFAGDNPTRETPMTATVEIIDKTDAQRFVIYEGWADMSAFTNRFPPRTRSLQRFHEYNMGDYHDWYVAYSDFVQNARPEVDVELLPVGRILSEMFTTGPLSDLPVEALYVDDAPHGTPTLYFLAGAITYVGLYQTPLPETVPLPDTLHPDVVARYPEVRAFIHGALKTKTTAAILPVSTSSKTSQTIAKPNIPSEGLGLPDPTLAMGLSEISDWSTQSPFVDLMKSARPWVGHLPGQWGGMTSEEIDFGGFLDSKGWVWGIPPDLEAVETFVLTDQPEEAVGLGGRYRLTYEGRGNISLTGRARVQSREEGEIWFEYQPGDGLVGVRIDLTDPDRTGDYIHNIRILHEDHIELYEAGMIFNPAWLARIEDLRVLRFMDWMQTNHSKVSEWSERPRVSDFSYAWRGVPVEVIVALGNRVGADIWVTLPHKATNGYAAEFARKVKSGLDPDLKVYAEYSNELWNFVFEQATWTRDQADARWGKDAAPDAWMQYAGMRAAEIARIWEWEFGAESKGRLVKVMSVHTGWKGLEQAQFQAPLWRAESRSNPAPLDAFDAYAVSGYFGYELGSDEGADQTLGWISASMQSAFKTAIGQGLKRVAMQEYVRDHLYDAAIPIAAQTLREGSLDGLLTDLLPYHANVAQENGLTLVMYEGGSHVAGVGEWANDEAMTNLFTRLSYSPEMGVLYQELLAGWRNLPGATFFNAYSDVASPSKWGSWGALRHLSDENPRFAALDDHNRDMPAGWENRANGAFLQGAIFEGTDGDDQLSGTSKRDVLLGGGGNDVLIGNGHGDNMHGGEGLDTVELPGTQTDYVIKRVNGRVFAVSITARFVMFDVEQIRFDDAPTELLDLLRVQ